jgi:hypothetical protein
VVPILNGNIPLYDFGSGGYIIKVILKQTRKGAPL